MKLKKQKKSRKHVKKTYKRRKTYRKRGGAVQDGGTNELHPIFIAINQQNVPAVRAILYNNSGVVNELVNYTSKKFNSSGPDVLVDMTPLYYAVSRWMIHKPVSQQFINGNTTKDEYYQIAELLIDSGADVDFVTTNWFPGWSPIHWAAEYCQLDMVNLLKSRGANIDATYQVPDNPPMSLRDVACMRLNDFTDIKNKRGALNYITQPWTGTAQRFPLE